jgi:hypothetical protein
MAEINFQSAVEGLTEIVSLSKKLVIEGGKINKEFEKTATTLDSIEKSLDSSTADGLKKINEVLKESNKITKVKIENDKALLETEKDLIKAENDLNKAIQEEEKANQQKIKTAQENIKKNNIIRNQQIKEIKLKEQKQKAEEKAIKTNKKLLDAYQKESNLLRKMKKDLKATVIEMRRLGKSEKEVEEATKDAAKEINKLDRELRDLDKSVGDSFREIGKYEEALEGLSSTANTVKGALVGVGTELVAGLLVESITSSREAQLELDKLQNKAKATAKVIGSYFVEGTVEFLEKVKRDEEAVKKLNSLTEEIAKQKNISKSFFSSDEEKKEAKISLTNLREKIVEERKLHAVYLEQEEVRRRIFANTDNVKTISDTIDALDSLSEKTQDVEITNNSLERSLALQIKRQQELKAVSDDDTRSLTETIAAKIELVKQDKKVADGQETLARNEIKIQTLAVGAELLSKNRITIEQALNLTTEEANELLKDKGNLLALSSETERAYTDAFIGYTNARTESSTTALETEEKLSKLYSDKLEIDLDVLIDFNDKVKSLNEAIIADDTVSNERRQKLLDTTRQLTEDSFDAQAKTIRDFTVKRIELNSQLTEEEKKALKEKVKVADIEELLAIKDARVFNEKLRQLGLSEIFETRTIEVIKEKIQANADLDESQKEVNKSLTKTNEINKDILDQEAQLEILRDPEIDTQEELEEAQENLEDKRLQNRIEAINKELEAVEKGSLEEVTLNQEKNDILLDQERKAVDDRIREKEKEIEKQEELDEKAAELRQAGLEAATEIATAAIDAISDAKTAAAQRELDQSIRNQEIISQGIENGSKLGEASLAHEKKVQAEREAELKRLESQALKLQALIALLQVWGQTGDLGETLAGFATIKTTASSLDGAFYEGTDSVGSDGSETKVHNGKDGYVAGLNKGEIVLNNKQSDEMRSLGVGKRTQILDLARMSDMGVAKGGQLVTMVNDNAAVVSELQEQNKLLRSLPGRMPQHKTEASAHRGYIKDTIQEGNKTTITHKRATEGWKR